MILALAVVCLGCGAEDDELAPPNDLIFPGWADKSDDLGSGLVRTRDPLVKVFDGYNHVTDTLVGRNCVLPATGALEHARFQVGGDQLTTEFKYIRSREELDEAMGIDAQATVKVGPLGGSASLGFSTSYKMNDKTLAILLRRTQTYTVLSQERHDITGDALDVLRSDAHRFVRECGHGYVAGVAYGAELSVLIQIESSSIEERTKIEGNLEAEGIRAGPVSIGAELGAAFSRALMSTEAKASVDVDLRGFAPTVDVSQLLALDENSFELVGQLHQEMLASVADDKCHDQGGSGLGACDGGPALGYLHNGARASVPMGVLQLPFQRTSNFPGQQEVLDGLLEVGQDARTAVRVLEEYVQLYRAMVSIHNDEVGAMVHSDAPYAFGVYDTSNALRSDVSHQELLLHAQKWARAYEPEQGDEVMKLADLIYPCWSRAGFGDFTDCQASPAETEGGQAILATMQQYAQLRVRPVHYRFDPYPRAHETAAHLCSAGWRQPTAAEASRLWFAVEQDPEAPACTNHAEILTSGRGAWHDSQGTCGANQGAWIEFLPTDEFASGCHTNGWAFKPGLIAICVPSSGVYDSSVPLLPGTDG